MSQEIKAVAYVSRAAFDYRQEYKQLSQAIEEIRIGSTRRNSRRDIGGVLYYFKGSFFQYLEGPKQEIDHLIRVIKSDSRHEDFKLILDESVSHQRKPNWGLEYVSLDNRIKRYLGDETLSGDLHDLSEAQAGVLVEIFVGDSLVAIGADTGFDGHDAVDHFEQMGRAKRRLGRIHPFMVVILGIVSLVILCRPRNFSPATTREGLAGLAEVLSAVTTELLVDAFVINQSLLKGLKSWIMKLQLA